ncbi:MAG: phosphatidylinositol kinase, partial [Candidatus Nanopelagicus sp.]
EDKQLRRLALFDAVINNTDRKFGHLLLDNSGKLFGCDHGVAFHKENKLRTVLWQFASQDFNQEETALLNILLRVDWHEKLSVYLTDDEIKALNLRIKNLSDRGKFPEPSRTWPAVPWPPV